MEIKNGIHKRKSLLLSILAILGYAWFKTERSLWLCVFFPILYTVICRVEQTLLTKSDPEKKRWCVLLTVIFAFCCVVGWSYEKDRSFVQLYASIRQISQSLSGFISYLILFYYGSHIVFYFGERFIGDLTKKPKLPQNALQRKYVHCLLQNPFKTAFITLMISYIPYIVVYYPGLFMGDSHVILGNGLRVLPLTNHTPVVYSLLVGEIVRFFYSVFSSWNAAIFAYSLIQFFTVITVVSYGIHILIKHAHVNWIAVLFFEAYVMIHPRISNYMFLFSKEVLYGAALMLFMEVLYLVICYGISIKYALLLGVSGLGILFFRSEGPFILLMVSLVFFLKTPRLRKIMSVLICSTILCFAVFQGILTKSQIKKGSLREAIGLMTQQTARYVQLAQDQVTPEEEEAILNAFTFSSLEQMSKNYVPARSDTIKFAFQCDVFSDAAKKYYPVWLEMAKKRPYTYLGAWFANYSEFFYPSRCFDGYLFKESAIVMVQLNELVGSSVRAPDITAVLRKVFENVREKLFSFAPFSIINTPAVYFWILLIWTSLMAYHKKKISLCLLTPVWCIFLVCIILNPCNGFYCRYQYPMLILFPWVMLLSGTKEI